MSEFKVDKISPGSGTAITLGDSGDTFTIPSGVTLANSGTATGFGTTSASDLTSGTLPIARIADDAITNAKMANDAIDSAQIADNAVTLAKMAGGTDGQIITYDASGNPVAVGPGTDGQVLTSTGAGSPPAFEALPGGGYTELGVANTTSGSSSTIGSIPAGVKTVLIVLNQVSTSGAGEFNLQLGDSGGLETSGYLSNAHKLRANYTNQIGYHDTAHFGIAQGGGGADPIMTVMHLTRNAAGQHTWVLTWNAYVSHEPASCHGVGRKTLSGELTQLALITNGTFDSGNWNAYYQ